MTKTKSVRTICATRNGVMRATACDAAPVGRQRAPAFPDVRFVLVPEMLQRRQHRRDRGVAEGAERLAGDVAGDASTADRDRASGLRRARCAAGSCAASRCPRGRACTCRTTRDGRSAAGSRPATTMQVVSSSTMMPAEPSSDPAFCTPSKLAWASSSCGQQNRHRRPAGDHGLERAAVAHAAGAPVDELAQRDVHRRFVDARPPDVARHAVELRPAVLLRPERREPLRAVSQDERHVGERLDVVHGGRTVVEADDGRKRRLVARLRALAFERFEQRRLFARFVRARAAMDEDVAVEARSENVLAEESARVGLVDRVLEHVLHVEELAADVDVGHLRADGVAGDRAALDQQVRIALHQQVVLERPRLAFVGVAGDVFRVRRLLVDELPFHAGRKPGAAAAAQARRLHDLDHLIGRKRERLLQPLVALVLQVEIEREAVGLAHVLGEERFHHFFRSTT